MAPLNISETYVIGEDERGFSVGMRTNKGTFGTEVWTHTPSDRRAITGVPGASFPGRVIGDARTLSAADLAKLAHDPAGFAKKGNTRLLTWGNRRYEHSLFLATMMVKRGLRYNWRVHDDAWVLALLGLRTDAGNLPALDTDTVETVLERVRTATATMERMPEDARKPLGATVKLRHPDFIDISTALVDAEAKLVFLEFQGSVDADKTNLGAYLDLLKSTKRPPYTVGMNVPRMTYEERASGPLWAAAYGVQTSLMKAGRWFGDDDPEAAAKMPWFVRRVGGYIPIGDVPRAWATGCACPDDPHIMDSSMEDMGFVRKRHEMVEHVTESATFAEAVRRKRFMEYLAERPVLRSAIR